MEVLLTLELVIASLNTHKTYIFLCLTHWGWVMHLFVGNLTIIGSDNGLSPGQRQAIIWTNAGILLIGPLGTNFSEISIEIQTFLFKKMCLRVSSGKWRSFCLGLNVLSDWRSDFWPPLVGATWLCFGSKQISAKVIKNGARGPAAFLEKCCQIRDIQIIIHYILSE